MIKKCLFCENDFEAKRESAKYCSDNCRVKWNYKFGKKKEVTALQVQVLYNSFLDMVGRLGNNKPLDAGFNEDRNGKVGAMSNTTKQILGIDKSVQQHMNEIADLDTPYEYERKANEIESATNLNRKQKDLLLLNMKTPKT